MIQPITYYCDSPTIRRMCDRYGDRFERMGDCDKSLLIWACANGHVDKACSLIGESVANLSEVELPEPSWQEFQDGLAADMAAIPAFTMQLIHALSQ